MREQLTQIKDKVSCETNRILSVAKGISDLECEDEKSVVEFAKDFSNTYFSLKSLIETQLPVEDSGTPLQSDISEQDAVEEQNNPYCWLVLYVTKIVHCICGISGENRRNMMINISDMLASYRGLVNYRNPAEPSVLSSLDVYPKLWRMSIDILVIEMNARFAYLRRIRYELFDNMQNL